MLNKFLILTLIFQITSCQNVKKEIDNFSLDNVLNNIECKENFQHSMLTEDAINDLIIKTKKTTIKKYNRIILMFYVEEGEVINTYPINIIVSNNTSECSIFHKGKVVKTKVINKFNISKFYRYISTMKKGKGINNNRLFLIDIKSNEINCFLYSNLKYQYSREIKKLFFLMKT